MKNHHLFTTTVYDYAGSYETPEQSEAALAQIAPTADASATLYATQADGSLLRVRAYFFSERFDFEWYGQRMGDDGRLSDPIKLPRPLQSADAGR